MSVDPLPDELLSSWLHRLAIANGIAPRAFAGVLGLGDGMWSPRLDLLLPLEIAALLLDQSGVPHEAISPMATTGCAFTPLLLPLRENAHRNRSTWMQYCPRCLADDDAPYFRRRWRLATRISCFVHGCGLRDRCPACRHGIATFDQVDLVPQHFCARCVFDLRGATKVPIKTAARRLERAVDDICRVEAIKGSPATSDLVPRLLRAPKAIDAGPAKSLTSLSTSARIRCFELLAAGPLDWLVAGQDAVAAHRRRSILAAGGHDGLIAGLADFLAKHQKRPRSDRPTQPSAGLADLLTAYLRVAGDRTASKLHRDLPAQRA
ncbi:TniQ family protein [Mesorhizobium sp. M0923]|uniref:TniQ family protein n=1 Tax=Mesorhizobium sp. M0923 TaxID=2957028 RepID=UPI00333C9893